MRKLIYLTTAETELTDIVAYVARESLNIQVAEQLGRRLTTRCERLATLPGTLGRPRPALADGLRSVADGSYIIFFRYAPGEVQIVRILHAARDLEALFEVARN